MDTTNDNVLNNNQHDEQEKEAEETTITTPPPATLRQLFSFISRRHTLTLLMPAMFFSVLAGGIAPFMTLLVGQTFNAFAQFPITGEPTAEDRSALKHAVGMASLLLVALAVASMALSSLTSCLWIWAGERNVLALRRKVYAGVMAREMQWFDGNAKMDSEGLGAGGLMAKFTRETTDVLSATSMPTGLLIQHLTTTITALVLAFTRSALLTLVILSAVPMLVIIQGLSQTVAGPLLAIERGQSAVAATLVDRALSSISTVKAFNAQAHELAHASATFTTVGKAANRLTAVWGLTSGLSQFSMMAMFVQAFWFGSKLVREEKITSGDVLAVFWACLIASSNLQMCIPQSITLTKGKWAMGSLLALIESEPSGPLSTPASPGSTNNLKSFTAGFRKIRPMHFSGELTFQNVSFSYPSRPTLPILEDVSLFLPAGEMTFVVGGSGSGKSTIAALIMRLYTPNDGDILLDDQDLSFLDSEYTQSNIACVTQTGCIIFDGQTIHDNVAMGVCGSSSGRLPEHVSREEVIDACRAALLHDFIRDLPQGYDTVLSSGGEGGASLSGGQRQRLGIARVLLRDPGVLILDEATSALDPTSRILVFSAIKRRRQHKTTIVITHDLSQIEYDDFVYVLKGGEVIEQGYRSDLESDEDGEMRRMLGAHVGGFLPERHVESAAFDFEELEEDEPVEENVLMNVLKHQSLHRPSIRPLTVGNWMFDVVADLTSNTTTTPFPRLSQYVPTEEVKPAPLRVRRRSSIHIVVPTVELPEVAHTLENRRLSLQFTPTSATFPPSHFVFPPHYSFDSEDEKVSMQRSGTRATMRRGEKQRKRWDKTSTLTRIRVDAPLPEIPFDAQVNTSFRSLVRSVYPTIPYKPLLAVGMVACMVSGAITPIFSFLISRLLFLVSIGAQDASAINFFGGLTLGVAALDGLFIGLKYTIMEFEGMSWVTAIRTKSFSSLLSQDRKFFDQAENTPVRMVQVLVKDGDEARNLLAIVLSQSLVVSSMVIVGICWALVRGWEMTLVGLAIAPIFVGVMGVQTRLVSQCELRNKRAREEVGRFYYEAISNVKGIRCMAFDDVFRSKFDQSAEHALKTGVRGAFVEGCTYGVASALIYLSEALLFYVGAVFVADGRYTYLQMVEVLNLVVFTVTIGSQLMTFTEKIAKSVQATRDFNELLSLSHKETDESNGTLKPSLSGDVVLKDVSFSYPSRTDAPVLQHLSLTIKQGECIAIVGPSGCGKSTVTALLQRLYTPTSGSISVNSTDLRATDVTHLREHVSVVSQNPHLFDASVEENIAYGSTLSHADIRQAAKNANVHDFVMSLPNGYNTTLGENAALVSGGQAQRLQIARALARPCDILILDECTSALDEENQRIVLDTVREAKVGRTTVMVTHKVGVMRMCERIVVLNEGRVVETGSYDELMRRKGVFATLANGGEWQGE